ncbi:MAG: hypothetical protein JKY56_14700 [Kofleriaceae bacterium]|nr:hypothetical protein [Kofleriaceae bacterium]
MAESSYQCSVSQGFNFQKDSQDTIGHIVSLKIGDTALLADFELSDPMDNQNHVKVFGVLDSIFWNGGYADPVQFSCNVSTANKNTLFAMLHKSLSNTTIEFEFVTYKYDPDTKKFFKCFHSGDAGALKGLVLKEGGDLAMQISEDEGYEVPSPKNFNFTLGVMPEDSQMAIHVAVSTDGKFAKQFGIATGA